MKRFMSKKLLVVGVAVVVALGIGGAAFAYFSSTGSGTGSTAVGTSSNLVITQLGAPMYNSIPGSLADVHAAESFEGDGVAELGNQITFSSPTGPLSSVVVTMANFASTTYSWPITLNIYNVGANNAVGSLITSDTQTFLIPVGGSAAPDHVATLFNITFNAGQFSPTPGVLPGTVIYGVSFKTGPGLNGSNGPSGMASSLNVGLSTEPTQPTVGSDPLTGTGSDYIDITSANGGGYSNGYCTAGLAENVFQYDPGLGGSQPCTTGQTNAINYPPPGTGEYYIPAVQFNESTTGLLYPGGASQPINFSVTNPGGGDEYITSVTITVSSITQTPAGLLLGTCNPAWFGITQPTAPSKVTITPGGTLTYDPSGASIALGDSGTNQDMCQGATVNLAFTSN